MIGHAAYKQAKNLPQTRIDVVLASYRKALDFLARARLALAENRRDAARPRLLNAQLIVMALASELPAYKDEASINFLRLYEFVAHQMAQGGIENVDAAQKVLETLYKGFEAVREQAIALEMDGTIPPIDRAQCVSMTA